MLTALALMLAALPAQAKKAEKQKNAPKGSKAAEASAAAAARAKKAEALQVAENFPRWSGFDTWLYGSARELTPSDLRGRFAVIVELKGAEAVSQFKKTMNLQSLGFNIPFSASFESAFPHSDTIVVYNFHGADASIVDKLKGDDEVKKTCGRFAYSFYTGVTFDGAPDPQGGYPFVYVMPPEGMEPLFKDKVKTGSETLKQVSSAIKKARSSLGKWHDWYGYVGEVKYLKTYDAAIASGKTLAPVEAQLRKAISSKNPEEAREAQMLYDAIWQKKGDLEYLIKKEAGISPVAAVYDYEELVSRFPAAKKDAALKILGAKVQSIPDVSAAMKAYESFRIASDPNRRELSPAEAKKLAADLKKAKPIVEKLVKSRTLSVQNAAFAMQQAIDELVLKLEAGQ